MSRTRGLQVNAITLLAESISSNEAPNFYGGATAELFNSP